MKQYSKLGAFALAAGLVLPLVAGAQPCGPMPVLSPPMHAGALPIGPGGAPQPPFLRGIVLSEAQQDEVFKLMHGAAPAMHQQAKVLRKAREELRTLSLTAPVDESTSKALVGSLARATAEMELLRLRVDQKIFALLTPDQRQKLKEEEVKQRH